MLGHSLLKRSALVSLAMLPPLLPGCVVMDCEQWRYNPVLKRDECVRKKQTAAERNEEIAFREQNQRRRDSDARIQKESADADAKQSGLPDLGAFRQAVFGLSSGPGQVYGGVTVGVSGPAGAAKWEDSSRPELTAAVRARARGIERSGRVTAYVYGGANDGPWHAIAIYVFRTDDADSGRSVFKALISDESKSNDSKFNVKTTPTKVPVRTKLQPGTEAVAHDYIRRLGTNPDSYSVRSVCMLRGAYVVWVEESRREPRKAGASAALSPANPIGVEPVVKLVLETFPGS